MILVECQAKTNCLFRYGFQRILLACTVVIVLGLVERSSWAYEASTFRLMGVKVERSAHDGRRAMQASIDGIKRPAGAQLTVPVPEQGESLLEVPDDMAWAPAIKSGRLLFEAQWESNAHLATMIGPRFDQSSCTACHTEALSGSRKERGQQSGSPYVVKVLNEFARASHGSQFTVQSSSSSAAQRQLVVRSERSYGRFADGEQYYLERPVIDAREAGVALPAEWFGLRVAPALFGWGLLSAVDKTILQQLEDPDDADLDGISGRLISRNGQIGRFGWKADQPTLKAQIAAALANDMGVTTTLASAAVCLSAACEPELDDVRLNAITDYVQHIGVPDRQFQSVTEARAGFQIFNSVGCSGCHVPVLQTAEGEQSAFSRQVIWAYTDLLVHDMGQALADPHQGRALVVSALGDEPAGAAEWRTPPLWGVGLLEGRRVHGFLHDGRAQTLDEAVLWHGGEAALARQQFMALPVDDRNRLMAFLRSL